MPEVAPAPLASSAGTTDWLGACRRATAQIASFLEEHPTTAERAVELGRGEGGDESVAVDLAAEDAVFAELDALHVQGARFHVLSEERGSVDLGDPDVLVVVDPIDGSLNCKRAVSHHALSIAVAEGATMADVTFAYVYDFGTGEEWTARRGAGAHLNGRLLDPDLPERRRGDGKLELCGIESAHPRHVAASIDALDAVTGRLRAVGAIAISLCQVAAARFDGMVSLAPCRSVDAAAAQLVVREAGGHVAFPRCADPLGAPLDLAPHSPVVAARSEAGLAALAGVPA